MEQWWTTTTICFVHSLLISSIEFHCSCLAHVINLGNVDVMSNITKIATVKNATAIWEYDPTWTDNRVLGGSLDIIATICTLAINVKILFSLKLHVLSHIISTLRFKHLDSISNTFTAPRSVVDFLKPWRYPYMAISVGAQCSRCLTRQINFVRYGLDWTIHDLSRSDVWPNYHIMAW